MLEKVMYNLVENSVRHGQGLSSIRLSCYEESVTMIILYEDDGGVLPLMRKRRSLRNDLERTPVSGYFLSGRSSQSPEFPSTRRESRASVSGLRFEYLQESGEDRGVKAVIDKI